MVFKNCNPFTNAQRIELWRERIARVMPDVTEEDLLRREHIGLSLRRAWHSRFEQRTNFRYEARQQAAARKPAPRPAGRRAEMPACIVHVLKTVAA